MKPILRRSLPQAEYSFVIRKDIGTGMRNNWHYHPEYELLFIKRSIGTWLVGDYIGQFKSGDIILLGPNIPHSFRHEYEYIVEKSKKQGEAIVIFFQKEFLGNSFMDLPEMFDVKNILQLSRNGLKITGETKDKLIRLMENIYDESPGMRLVNLMSMLQLIAERDEYQILATKGFTYHIDQIDNTKMNAIFEYTFKEYQNPISIEKVASLVNMSKQAFCRYFKEKTKKTFVQFLMEIRIGKACRLLIENDMNASEICYLCGYNSVSHFNHQFKSIKNKSPLEFKQDHLKCLQAFA